MTHLGNFPANLPLDRSVPVACVQAAGRCHAGAISWLRMSANRRFVGIWRIILRDVPIPSAGADVECLGLRHDVVVLADPEPVRRRDQALAEESAARRVHNAMRVKNGEEAHHRRHLARARDAHRVQPSLERIRRFRPPPTLPARGTTLLIGWS